MFNLQYNIVLKSEKEGGYTVIVPSLPGCVTYGKDLKQAKEMATDAIRAYVTSLTKHNEPVPSDEESYISNIQFTLPKINKKIVYA
jgi:antitoxin HicB